MKENLKDILSNLNPGMDQETLLRYLQGQLSPEEQHEVEKHLLDQDFDADAMEGLDHFDDKKKITGVVEQLNLQLKKNTEKKRKARAKRALHVDPSVIIAIVVILLLVVTAFFVIMKMKGR